jgi:MFS family permease
MATGTFLGPYLGAEASHWFGRASVFWITSALSLLGALQLHLFAFEERPLASGPHGSFATELWQASLALVRQRVFGWLLVLLLLLRLGQNMLEPFVVVFVGQLGPLPLLVDWSATRELAIDRTVAIAMGLLAIGQWLCTPLWGRGADRYGPLRCLALLALGLAALFAAMTTVATTGQFLLLRCVFACLMAGSMTLGYAAASKRVADRHRTLAFAMVQSCIQLGLALGPNLGAFAASGEAGVVFPRLFACAAVLCGAAGVGMLVLRRVAVPPRAP